MLLNAILLEMLLLMLGPSGSRKRMQRQIAARKYYNARAAKAGVI